MFGKRNERVECADGFSMSVQAFDGAYCAPRDDDGPYTEVEVGFPSEKDADLDRWIEDPDAEACEDTGHIKTVYAYVPVSVISSVIEKHGGMVAGELPEFDAAGRVAADEMMGAAEMLFGAATASEKVLMVEAAYEKWLAIKADPTI